MKQFRQSLVTLRRATGLSQAELASRIGVNEDTIGKWERGEEGEKGPKLGNLEALAREFGVTVPELLSDKPDPATLKRLSSRVEELETKYEELLRELRRRQSPGTP